MAIIPIEIISDPICPWVCTRCPRAFFNHTLEGIKLPPPSPQEKERKRKKEKQNNG
jgi:hypothetical protein